ncbi:MAG: hypothetical protein JWQ48_1687 [Conexibacter sp.]|nr:hypothetical protein [Conexibacter sp.]
MHDPRATIAAASDGIQRGAILPLVAMALAVLRRPSSRWRSSAGASSRTARITARATRTWTARIPERSRSEAPRRLSLRARASKTAVDNAAAAL